jgi:hypothetical protein
MSAIDFTKIKPADVLRGVEALGTIAAPFLPGPWGTIARGLGTAVGLAADLWEHGLDPHGEITQLRSSVPDMSGARQRLRDRIAQTARAK